MPRTIEPLDDTLTSPETIGDRSHLAKLYERPTKATEAHSVKIPVPDVPINPLGFGDTMIVNLLITVPYMSSFLSVVAAYSLPSSVDVGSALESRVGLMVLTVTALGPWVYAIRVLRNKFWSYKVRFSGLVAMYAFFIFPVLAISVKLHEKGTSDILILGATFVLSQVFIWLLAYALKGNSATQLSKFSPSILMILVLISFAIFYR